MVGFENHSGQTRFISVQNGYENQTEQTESIENNTDSTEITIYSKSNVEPVKIKKIQREDCKPLGKVVYGYGNNLDAEYEGCVYKNAIGTYLHGSVLPKNPFLSDYLILKALDIKLKKGQLSESEYKQIKNTQINDQIADKVNQELVTRFTQE